MLRADRRPPRETTLVEVLRHRAETTPSRLALSFLADGEGDGTPLTYAALDRAARATAVLLLEYVRAGDRVVLLHPPGLDFVTAVFGCFYAGVIAVPAAPLQGPRRERGLHHLLAVVGDARPAAVVTTEAARRSLEDIARSSPELSALTRGPVLSAPATDADADRWRAPRLDGTSLAVLQYTSGSTSEPRGVMVSHGNVLFNCEYARHLARLSAEDVSVSWLPHFHDLGLIDGILQPICSGFPGYLMAPAAFLHTPRRWVSAMSRLGATHTSGPTFAYELAVRRTTPEERAALDLSRLSCAMVGAEPIHQETLDRFATAYAPSGFRRDGFCPGYGLAEATLVVSVTRRDDAPGTFAVDADQLARGSVAEARPGVARTRAVVSCGPIGEGVRVEIVDPESLRRCPPDRVGEIWVSGPTVAQGYWGREAETEQLFAARLADTGEGAFLRTGDLGFMAGGELYVMGRLKDMLIIHGVNYHPQDFESIAHDGHPALRSGCSAVFSIEDAGEERLVIVAEVEATRSDATEVIATLRARLEAAHGVPVHRVVLIGAGALPKTTSGKVKRSACRIAYQDGSLPVVAEG